MVIDPDPADLSMFVRLCLEKGYYVDETDARDALRHRSMFNVIDPASGYKLDLIVRKDRPFSRKEFSRRTNTVLPGVEAFMVTPEDAILSKLEWAREGQSEQQYLDQVWGGEKAYMRYKLGAMVRLAQEQGGSAENAAALALSTAAEFGLTAEEVQAQLDRNADQERQGRQSALEVDDQL